WRWRGFRRRKVVDRLEVDRRIINPSPFRLFHRQPTTIGLKSPGKQPLRFMLLPRNVFDYVLVEALGRDFGFDRADKSVLIRLNLDRTNAFDRLLDSRHKGNLLALAVLRTAGGGSRLLPLEWRRDRMRGIWVLRAAFANEPC